MAIDITLVAGVKDFLRGTKDAAEGLEDVADALDDLGDEGSDAAKKLESKFEQALKSVSSDSKKAANELDDNIRRGTKGAEDSLDEFKREANSTAKESAASFDGSAESIIDSFQEIAANAFAGFGPAGALAGLVAAAGIGMAVKSMEDGKARTEEFKAKVEELSQAFIESGEQGMLSTEQYIDALKELASQSDDTKANLEDVWKVSKTGVATMDELASAIADAGGSTDELLEKLYAQAELNDTLQHNNQWNFEYLGILQEQGRELDRVIESIETQTAATEEAAAAQQAANEAGLPQLQARLDMQNMINDAYDEAAGNVTEFVNQETGLFDTAAYIASMEERAQALKNYQNNLAQSGLSEEAKQFLNEQGAEAASLMLEGYTSGDAATKASLNKIWTEAGEEASGAATSKINDTFKTPTEVKLEAKLNAKKATEELDAIARSKRVVDMTVRYVDREGNPVG